MNQIAVPEKLRATIDLMPENGMGFHVVDVRLANGECVPGVMVLNGEVLLMPYDPKSDIADLKKTN